MRRRSAGERASSWGSLDGDEGGSSAELACGDTGEGISTVAASDVLRIEQGDWLVLEGLVFVLCAFEGEVLVADEIKTESELVVGEDLAVLRERGVGILDVVRHEAGLETGLASRERLVGIVVVLTEGNDNWYVSAPGTISEHG